MKTPTPEQVSAALRYWRASLAPTADPTPSPNINPRKAYDSATAETAIDVRNATERQRLGSQGEGRSREAALAGEPLPVRGALGLDDGQGVGRAEARGSTSSRPWAAEASLPGWARRRLVGGGFLAAPGQDRGARGSTAVGVPAIQSRPASADFFEGAGR